MALAFIVLFNVLMYVLAFVTSVRKQKSVAIFVVLFVIQILLVILMLVTLSKKNAASDFISLGFYLLVFTGFHIIAFIILIVSFIKRIRS